jgi:Xaa-Pro dipeptidase
LSVDVFYEPQRVASVMDAAALGALIATTAPNIQYFTRYRKPGGALAMLCREDLHRPQLLVPSSSLPFCLEDPCDAVEIKVYGSFIRYFADEVQLDEHEAFVQRLHRDARTDATGWDLVAESLRSSGLDQATVAVDTTADGASELTARLPGLKVQGTPALFRKLRMIKSSEEIRRLAEAARITEHAIDASVNSVSRGTTQQCLARAFSLAAISSKSSVRLDSVSIGRGAAFGNFNRPGDVVEDGSIIRYDVGVHYRGYASDVSRCFLFRTSDKRAMDYHAALVEGQQRALDGIRPGVAACEVFKLAIDGVRKAGIPYYDRSHVGHGIGIAGAGYDLPSLAPSDETPLEPGMVLCVETPYTEVGYGGLQIEDMVVVTEEGYRPLTHMERQLQVVP